MRYTTGEFYRSRDTFADRIYCSEDTFAVADGMGIGEGGKLAAEKAIELVDKYRPFTSLEDMEDFFKRANRKIMSAIDRLGDKHMAGTTLSVLSLLNGRFIVGHVGDSRIYLWRKGRIKLLTQDQVMFKGGKKYVHALGIEWNPQVVLTEGELKEDDVFLLISDGVIEVLTEEELEGMITEDIDESARKILQAYSSYNPKEDLSFVIVSSR